MKNIGLKTIIVAGLAIMCTAWLAGYDKKIADLVTRSSFLLDTFVAVTLYDTEDRTILDGCMTLCSDYEKLFGKTLGGGEIYKLNHRRPSERTITISERTAQVLAEGLEYCRMSRGAFDITVESLSSLRGFIGETPHMPPKEETEAGLKKAEYRNVILDDGQIIFPSNGTTIDLGAITRGSITDQIKTYLEGERMESAVINLDGNVFCVGGQPDGIPFKIGLRRPYATHTETVATLKVDSMSVVPPDVYERYLMEKDINYHHILDPSTGYPHENGLIRVSIISPGSMDGGGPNTACFALRLEEGTRLIESMDQIYGIFLTENGELHYTGGAKDFLYR